MLAVTVTIVVRVVSVSRVTNSPSVGLSGSVTAQVVGAVPIQYRVPPDAVDIAAPVCPVVEVNRARLLIVSTPSQLSEPPGPCAARTTVLKLTWVETTVWAIARAARLAKIAAPKSLFQQASLIGQDYYFLQ